MEKPGHAPAPTGKRNREQRNRMGCERKTEHKHTLTYTKYGSNECIKVNKTFVRQAAAFGPVWHSLRYLYAFFFDERVAAHSFYFFYAYVSYGFLSSHLRFVNIRIVRMDGTDVKMIERIQLF